MSDSCLKRLFSIVSLMIRYYTNFDYRIFYSAANWFKCGMETLLLGGSCATVAYTVGQFVDAHVVQTSSS